MCGSMPSGNLPGTITAISPMADQKPLFFNFRMRWRNLQHLLKPGMAAEVIFADGLPGGGNGYSR